MIINYIWNEEIVIHVYIYICSNKKEKLNDVRKTLTLFLGEGKVHLILYKF